MTSLARPRDRVVLGVAGRTARHPAVRWAGQEANLRQTSLIVTPARRARPESEHDPRRMTDPDLLEQIATVATRQAPAVPVATQLPRAGIRANLLALAGTAALVVIGARPAPAPGAGKPIARKELFLGAHASCPVLVVEDVPTELADTVLVAWAGPDLRTSVLLAGAEEAALRGWNLLISALTPDLGRGQAGELRQLERDLSAISRRHPQLSVDVLADSTDAGIDQSRSAGLVVLGCQPVAGLRRVEDPRGLVGALLEGSRSPVMLVGPYADVGWTQLTLGR